MPKGSPEDLLNALSIRIDELSGDAPVESSTTISDASCPGGICELDRVSDVYGNADDERAAYVAQLMDMVMSDCPNVTEWSIYGGDLYIDAVPSAGDDMDIITYQVPLRDLKLTPDSMFQDYEYIENALLDDDMLYEDMRADFEEY